jgi:hypothetical protein
MESDGFVHEHMSCLGNEAYSDWWGRTLQMPDVDIRTAAFKFVFAIPHIYVLRMVTVVKTLS